MAIFANTSTQFIIAAKASLFAVLASFVLLLSTPAYADKGRISVESLSIKEVSERSYILNAALRYELSDYLRNGLRDGISIINEIDIRLVKTRSWWWDKKKTINKITTKLQYHALSHHYQVIRLDTNEHWNFKSLNTALRKLGSLRTYHLPKLPKQIDSGKYQIEIYISLKPDTFKFPMKIHSLFVNKYKIEKSGVTWSLP